MKRRYLFLLGAVLLALDSGSASAFGWWGPYYPTGGCPAARTYTDEYVPYFAKHPPVYYSRPVARPYGYYPYAYSPEAHVSRTVPARPLLVANHYVGMEVQRSDQNASSPTPLTIVNPFAREADQPLDAP